MSNVTRYPSGSQERKLDTPIVKLRTGEVPIYWPRHVHSKRVQAVTLGKFRDKTPILHFRNYRRNPIGEYVFTKEGASFTLAEFRKIVLAVNDLIEAAPDLAEMSGAL